MTNICVGKLTITGSDNGLSPGRCQPIIRTNAGILLIGTLGTNFSEILSEIHTFSFKKMHLKMSSGRWRPFCLCLNMFKTSSSHHDIIIIPGSIKRQMVTIPLSHFVFLEAIILNETAILKVKIFSINATTPSKAAWQCPCDYPYWLLSQWSLNPNMINQQTTLIIALY